jgi:hypothetical protein
LRSAYQTGVTDPVTPVKKITDGKTPVDVRVVNGWRVEMGRTGYFSAVNDRYALEGVIDAIYTRCFQIFIFSILHTLFPHCRLRVHCVLKCRYAIGSVT